MAQTESPAAVTPQQQTALGELGSPERWSPFRSLIDDLFMDRAVTVELEQGVLSIRGEKKSVRDEKLERGRRRECAYGSFSPGPGRSRSRAERI